MEEVRSQNIRVFQVNPSEVSTAFGNPEREERRETDSKLGPDQLAQTISAILELPDKAFIPELSVWATNPKF
jgi:3-oxoacyl-[acyl-carrier protein] reductase